jgi:hypothetical protein
LVPGKTHFALVAERVLGQSHNGDCGQDGTPAKKGSNHQIYSWIQTLERIWLRMKDTAE